MRSTLIIAFGVLLGGALFVTQGDAQPDSFKEIAKGVWFRHGDITGKGHCNNTVIEMKDGLLVVDANFPSGAEALMADIKKVSSKPVKWVFDTHHHGDHAYGNAVWTAMGATTIAHENVAKEMKRLEPARWQQTAKERKDVAALNQASVEPPKQTFNKALYVMNDGERRVEFHHFGWAHTRGDGFVYLPNEKILCSGDAATNGPFNYTADAHVSNWPKVMAAALRLDIAHVLPGHGAAGGKEILEGQRDFMIALRSAAAEKGKKLEDLVQMDGDKALFAKVKLPETVKRWVGPGLAGQLRDAFTEVTTKHPAGETSR